MTWLDNDGLFEEEIVVEKKSIDRIWAWGIAICVMLLLMQLHDILLRREKLLYDAAYEQGYSDGSGEEEKDTGFLDSEHLWVT